MKAHWKSSENPLYVRIIRKQNGIRHVLLKNETGTQSFYATSSGVLRKSPSSTSPRKTMDSTEASLEEKKLENGLLQRETSSSRVPSSNSCTSSRSSVGCVQNPIAVVVECFEKKTTTSEGTEDYLNDDPENVAFANRILQWLHSTNVLAKHFGGRMNEAHVGNEHCCSRDRPNTATILLQRPLRDKKNVRFLPERLDTVDSKPFSDSKTQSATQGRPQLHVYIPMFEKERKSEFLS